MHKNRGEKVVVITYELACIFYQTIKISHMIYLQYIHKSWLFGNFVSIALQNIAQLGTCGEGFLYDPSLEANMPEIRNWKLEYRGHII